MMRRILPQPVLTLALALLWLLLAGEASAGAAVLGLVIGVAVPLVTSRYWPDRHMPSRPLLLLPYAALVLWDIVVSNVEVARLVLFGRADGLPSRFVAVPLDLRRADAIAVLAATITMTPGTVSADLSADGRSLLVHCLSADDPDAVVAAIKHRYERRLKEIFE